MSPVTTQVKNEKDLKHTIPVDIDFENVIIYNLFESVEYFNTVYPKFNSNYLNKFEASEIFKEIKDYYNIYGEKPKPKEIFLSINNNKGVTKEIKESLVTYIRDIFKNRTDFDGMSPEFLINETTEYVQKNELIKGLVTLAKSAKQQDIESLEIQYNVMGEALQINFKDDTVYHYDGEENFLDRLKEYKKPSNVIPTHISALDESFGGGLYEGTLNVIASQTHGGKSAAMVCIGNNIKKFGGKNVYFATLEMPAGMVSRRFDANFLQIPSNDFAIVGNDTLMDEYKKMVSNYPNQGQIKIDSFPAHVFSVDTLKNQLEKLKVNHGFIPDIVIIDYLTLMKSTRLHPSVGSYTYFKSVAEELHGFAKISKIPVLTAQQINRGGFNQEVLDMSNISDSMGIAMAADTFSIIQRTPALDELDLIKWIKEKDRMSGNLNNLEISVEYSTFTYTSITDEHGNIRHNVLPNDKVDMGDDDFFN